MARWGAPLWRLLITALPMVVNLPVLMKFGLTMGGKIPPHWPPFLPERAYILRLLMEKDEFVISDSPAFVAWYADVPCVNLPMQRLDYEAMKAKAEERGAQTGRIRHDAGVRQGGAHHRHLHRSRMPSGVTSSCAAPCSPLTAISSPQSRVPFKTPVPLVGTAHR
jgi:hypothetical protein